MASPHPHYPQPGPSSIPYPPTQPPHFAFGGNPPYQMQMQYPPTGPPSPHAPRIGNGVNRSAYAHQGHARPGPTYHPHYTSQQTYQPGFYPPLEHQQHVRPPQPPYQQHHNGGPIPMTRPPNGPNRPPPFIHPNAQRRPPPFSPPFPPHGSPYSHPSPGHSPSALPKQLLMPPPSSPSPQSPPPLKPVTHNQLNPSHPALSHGAGGYVPSFPAVLSSPVAPSSPAVPSSPTRHPTSPAPRPSSPTPRSLSQAHHHLSPMSQSLHLSLEATSPSGLELSFPQELPEPHKVFPERTNLNYAHTHRRPAVLRAVAVTVSSAARPPRSFYDRTAPIGDGTEVAPSSPSLNSSRPPASPSPEAVPVLPKAPVELDSPLQQSLASSTTTTTTPATSTAPHTPMPGSPVSSVTSVSISLPAKSPSSAVTGTLPVSPSLSVQTVAMDGPTEAVATPHSQISPKSAPPPLVKKSWASLLRPAASGSVTVHPSTGPNSLPVSSVQGFSIPASASGPGSSSAIPRSNPGLVTLLTSPNALAGQGPPIRARGLINLGNMCFANTVLQVLVYCPPFHKLFTELGKYALGPVGKERKEISKDTPLVTATVTFMKEFRVLPPPPPSTRAHEEEKEDKGRDSLVPSYVYEALKEKKRFDSMRGGQQEDAEEFLGFYLDTLEEELLSIITDFNLTTPSTPSAPVEERVEEEPREDGWLEVGKKNKTVVTRTHKTIESPISRIFGGKSRTALKVPGARESVMVDPWSRLQLDIQPDSIRTIEDALCNIATPGTVQVTSSLRPGVQVDASQQTLIENCPPVLVLHLKRFLYDTTVNDVAKLSKKVTFGTELEIPKDAMASTRRSRPNKYKLFGVLNHHGSSATGGHYTLDVLHPDPRDKGREGWIRIDDDFVQDIRAEDLLVRDEGDDRSAYLLFYRRLSLAGSGTHI